MGPSRSLDLGTIAFAPRQARRYEAHLCVRNNFTTLECATLRGDGDEVRVHVAKKPGGSTVVSDVAFRLPRAGAGADSASDVLTQTIHVSNRGSSTVSVAKPYVGALECGGDGSHAGYYVQPCGAFALAPGASKRLTVVCLPEKAAETAAAPGAWTRLAMEVTSPDGKTSSLTAQLRASEQFATGAYAAGELDETTRSWSGSRRRRRRHRRGNRVARVDGTNPIDRPDTEADRHGRGCRGEGGARGGGWDDRGGEGERGGG